MHKISAFAGVVALALGVTVASSSAFATETVQNVCPPVNDLQAPTPSLTDNSAPAVTDEANGDCRLTQQSFPVSERHVIHRNQEPIEPVPESSAVH